MRTLSLVATILISFFCIFASSPTARAANPDDAGEAKRILLLYSYSGSAAPDAFIVDAFAKELGQFNFDLSLKHMELKSFFPEKEKEADRILAPELPALERGEYDVVIPIGQQATDLLARTADRIPESTAIVFAGLNVDPSALCAAHPNTTGVQGRASIQANVDLALHFFPKTKRVILLSNSNVQGRRILDEIRKIEKFHPQIEFVPSMGESASSPRILDAVAGGGEDSVALFFSWFRDEDANLTSLRYLKARLRKGAMPVFVLQEPMLWDGAFGGVYTELEPLGTALADFVSEVLSGARASDIPIRTLAPRAFVNNSMLKEYDIPLSQVPAAAELLGEDPIFNRKNLPVLVAGAISVALLILLFLTVSLLFLRLRIAYRRSFALIRHAQADLLTSGDDEKPIFMCLHRRIFSRSRCKGKSMPRRCTPRLRKIALEVLKTGLKQRIEQKFGGRDFVVEFVRLSKSQYGPRDAVLWIFRDVTSLAKAKRALAEDLRRSRLILSSIGDAVIVTNAQGCVMFANHVAASLCGMPSKAMRGRGLYDAVRIVENEGGTDRLLAQKALDANLATSIPNLTIQSGPEETRQVSLSLGPLNDNAGICFGTVVVLRDLSLRKENILLQNTLKTLDYALELTKSASCRMNLLTRKIEGSPRLADFWPVRDGKMIRSREFVCPEDLPAFSKSTEALFSRKKAMTTWTFRSKFFGDLRFYRARASIGRNELGEPCLIGVIQDITEIASVSRRLQGTMDLWNMAIETLPVLFFVKDADNDFRFVQCNRKFAETLGRSKEEILGRTDLELFPNRGDAERFREQDLEVMGSKRAKVYEDAFLDARGSIIHCQTTKTAFTDPNGQRLILGVSNDISKLKQLIYKEQFHNDILAFSANIRDFNQVFQYIAERFSMTMDCQHVILATYGSDGEFSLRTDYRKMLCCECYDENIKAHAALLKQVLPDLKENKIVEIQNLAKRKTALNPKCRCTCTSLIAAPIFLNAKLWGALAIASANPALYRQCDHSLMRACVNVIAIAELQAEQQGQIRRQEMEQQLILDHVGIPICLYDNAGKLLNVNAAVAHFLGQEEPDGALKAFPNELIEGQLQSISKALTTRKTIQQELKYGSGCYKVQTAPAVADDERTLYVVRSIVDITDYKRLLNDQKIILTALEALFREEDAEQAVALFLNFVQEHFKSSRCYILEFNPANATCRVFAETCVADRPPIFQRNRDMSLRKSSPLLDELRRKKAMILNELEDDDYDAMPGDWSDPALRRSIRSQFLSTVHLNDRLWGAFGIIYENESLRRFKSREMHLLRAMTHVLEIILERRQTGAQLGEALRQAQAANRTKSYFIASVSHELRTPLNSVLGFSELLKNKADLSQEQKDWLDNIMYSGEALLQLINDVLDLSKLEADRMDLVLTPVDFEKLGTEVMRVFSMHTIQRGLELKVSIKSMPVLELDMQRMRQILFNLIGNAIKFTQQGSVTLQAEFIPDKKDAGTLRFAVIDTGIGIAKEDQERLFESFVQLHNIRGANTQNGTGLGLAITQKLVERMGGKLTLDSEPGKGSAFRVALCGVRVSERKSVAALKLKPPSAEPGPLIPKNAKKLAILVVDDIELNRMVLCRMLNSFGIERVLTAASGDEALEQMRKETFDLVFTDLWMPGMDGKQFLAKIRANDDWANVAIFAVTADVETREGEGFDGVLLKPLTRAKLQTMLSDFMQGIGARPGWRPRA